MVIADLTQVRGRKTGRTVLAEESMRIQAARLCLAYEEHYILLPTLLDNVSIRGTDIVDHSAPFPTGCTCGRVAGAFTRIVRAQRVAIRNVGPTFILVRFHTSDADPVTIDGGEYLSWDFMECEDLFFTNTSPAAVAVPVRVTIA